MEEIKTTFVKERPKFPKRAIVTFGMPYGNKELHFGHLFGMILSADFFSRFLKNRIGKENVILQSGTDAYGSTMALTYEKLKEQGIVYPSMLDMIKHNHDANVQTMKKAEIDVNFFGASAFGEAKEEHEKVSKEFFEAMMKTGNLIKTDTEQFYDEELGVFLNGRQVVGKCPYVGCLSEKAYADECDFCHQYLPKDLINPVSMLSHKTPILKKVTNWYFDITEYLDKILALIEDEEKDRRNRKYMLKEIKEFLKKPEIYVKQEFFASYCEIKEKLPNHQIVDENTNKPSFTIIFEKLKQRELACDVLNANGIKYRTGKTLVPFRITANYDWGVPAPSVDGVEGRTFYVWPESLWAPISFTKTYLKTAKNVPSTNYKEWWCSDESEIYQFIGEDNMYFYGPPQQAMWMAIEKEDEEMRNGKNTLKQTHLIPNKHSLFMGLKASSSGKYKAPLAREVLEKYNIDTLRMHFLAMGFGETNVNVVMKAFNPDANENDEDVTLKEGNLLVNVYNRVLRRFSFLIADKFSGVLQLGNASEQIKEMCKKEILNQEERMYNYKFHVALNGIDSFVKNINKWFDNAVKNAKEDNDSLTQIAVDCLYALRVANTLLNPYIPSGTERVAKFFNFNEKYTDWKYIFDNASTFVEDGTKIERLEDEQPFFKN